MLCPDCSVPGDPPERYLVPAARLAAKGGLEWDALPKSFRRAAGCAKCSHTGFRGRTIIAEMLEVTPEIAAALREGAPAGRLESIAVGQGMTTLAADGLRRAAEGQTTIEEVLGVLDVAELPRAGWGE
jgi:type II secretory ATPase GspE/PulE/Tfp pilus assembly ATPase PilB-like protein